MKKTILTAAITSTLSLSAICSADTQINPYTGLDVGQISYSETGDDLDFITVGAKLGVEFTEYFRLEGRLGTGITDDQISDSDSSQEADFTLDYAASAFAIGRAPITKKFAIYGMAGYTKAEITVDAPNYDASADESDFSYGAGAEFIVSDDSTFSAEYLKLMDKESFELEAINFAIKLKI